MNLTLITLGLLFGGIGYIYFTYGRKQQNVLSLIIGIVLMVIPYFISSVLPLISVSAVLMITPFVAKKFI